jgi:hypothetical protein
MVINIAKAVFTFWIECVCVYVCHLFMCARACVVMDNTSLHFYLEMYKAINLFRIH